MIKHIILALSVSLLAVACGGAPAEPAAPEGGEAKPAEGAPADAKPAEGAPAGDAAAAPAGDAATPADAPK